MKLTKYGIETIADLVIARLYSCAPYATARRLTAARVRAAIRAHLRALASGATRVYTTLDGGRARTYSRSFTRYPSDTDEVIVRTDRGFTTWHVRRASAWPVKGGSGPTLSQVKSNG